MGGNRAAGAVSTRLVGVTALVGLATLSTLSVACGNDDSAPSGQVGPSSAYTAIVEWQAGEQEPVLNDDGTERLPVIYIVAADGDTIDVGIQADVAAATVDVADVRFADEPGEAFDTDLDVEPVIDHGVMLLVGALPDPAPIISVDVLRYLSVATSTPFRLQITADDTTSNAIDSATVTSVTQP